MNRIKVILPGEGAASIGRRRTGSRRRCDECRQPRFGVVRAFLGRETERYVCPACLETNGQTSIDLTGDPT